MGSATTTCPAWPDVSPAPPLDLLSARLHACQGATSISCWSAAGVRRRRALLLLVVLVMDAVLLARRTAPRPSCGMTSLAISEECCSGALRRCPGTNGQLGSYSAAAGWGLSQGHLQLGAACELEQLLSLSTARKQQQLLCTAQALMTSPGYAQRL